MRLGMWPASMHLEFAPTFGKRRRTSCRQEATSHVPNRARSNSSVNPGRFTGRPGRAGEPGGTHTLASVSFRGRTGESTSQPIHFTDAGLIGTSLGGGTGREAGTLRGVTSSR